LIGILFAKKKGIRGIKAVTTGEIPFTAERTIVANLCALEITVSSKPYKVDSERSSSSFFLSAASLLYALHTPETPRDIITANPAMRTFFGSETFII